MEEAEQAVETEAGPEQPEQSNLERLQNISDDEIGAALEGHTRTGEARFSVTEPDRDEPVEQSVDVAEVWEQALEDHPELLGREDELAEIARTYPDLFKASSEEEALAGLTNAKHLLDAADEQAELSEMVSRQATDTAIDAIAMADDDVAVLRALDHLADRVPLDSPEFMEALATAEELAPAATIAFLSMVQGAAEQEQQELEEAKEAALHSRAEAIFAAIKDESDKSKPLGDERVQQVAAELARDAALPTSPEQAREQVRLIAHAAEQVDKVDRVNQFLREFDTRTIARIPDDGERAKLSAEASRLSLAPAIDIDTNRLSSDERQAMFKDAFDAHFAPSRALRDETNAVAEQVQAKAQEARAKGQKR